MNSAIPQTTVKTNAEEMRKCGNPAEKSTKSVPEDVKTGKYMQQLGKPGNSKFYTCIYLYGC